MATERPSSLPAAARWALAELRDDMEPQSTVLARHAGLPELPVFTSSGPTSR